MSNEMLEIGLDEIRENPVALRAVNRQSEEYQGLVDSIKEKGVINAINVRRKHDDESNTDCYELIDGLHRFSACKDAGLSSIPALVLSASDADVLDLQLAANIHKIETKPIEYTQQLKRILGLNPMMTIIDLAAKVNKSIGWINDRMSLTKIQDTDIKNLIDDGTISLGNAYALAKLPPEEHAQYLEAAINTPPNEFVATVNERAKEIREAKRRGADASKTEFSPAAHMQKMGTVKEESEKGAIGESLVASTGASTAVEGFALAVKWLLHLDPESVSVQKEKWETQQAEKAEKKRNREEATAKKKAEKASKDAEAAKEAADALASNQA